MTDILQWWDEDTRAFFITKEEARGIDIEVLREMGDYLKERFNIGGNIRLPETWWDATRNGFMVRWTVDPDEQQTLILDEYRHQQEQFANPPEPWKTFGTYANDGIPPEKVEFWGDDGAGLPIWERIKE